MQGQQKTRKASQRKDALPQLFQPHLKVQLQASFHHSPVLLAKWSEGVNGEGEGGKGKRDEINNH